MQKPKFILSKPKVLEQYNKVKSHADLVSYSSKTNQDVTKILEKETDSLFSVHLENELKHLEDMSRVLFLAQGWTSEYAAELIAKGIKSFVVDNEPDLDVILDHLKNNDVKINLFLRMRLKENTIRTEKYFVFGMYSDVINRRINEIADDTTVIDKIERLGIHFHRKTQNMSEWSLKYELNNVLDTETLEKIDIINIGGGIPSFYANTNEDVIRTVFDKIDELRIWLKEKDVQIMIEPGRFIAAPAVKLVTNIIAIHENNIIVNASVYNTDMDALIVPVKLLVEGELTRKEAENDEQVRHYVIKGNTPCSMDLFRYRAYLKNPKAGDELVFLNAGAYNFATDFCDLEKIETEIGNHQ